MNIEKSRKEFEEWYLAEFYEGDKQCGLEWLSTEPCGGYRYSAPAESWKAWQASRTALVIDLPTVREYDDHWTGDVECFDKHEVVEAIEAAGVKWK